MVSQERDSKRIAIYIHTYSSVDMRSNLYEQLLHCSLTQICVWSVNINNLKKIKHRVVSEYQWCSRGFESIGGRQTCLYRNLFTTHRKTSTKNIKTILCSIACAYIHVCYSGTFIEDVHQILNYNLEIWIFICSTPRIVFKYRNNEYLSTYPRIKFFLPIIFLSEQIKISEILPLVRKQLFFYCY